MLAIKGQPGRDYSSVTDLAEALQLKPNSVVELVDRSVASGLLVRETDEEDHRKVRIRITEKGEKILDTLSIRNLAELK
ncbi:MarR family winged helix-turn-helix transcriptional regulator, partial [Salmonella enterica]|uniref:MarR family winged helix-turn-helix transcriptional regulator n=1 Tax=Salmonella enterica TaxID=28901 RepID=UPI003D2971D5